MELFASYHPGAREPAVLLALGGATLWLSLGGFLIVRTIARRTPFTWRLFSLHVAGLAVLVAGVRPLEDLTVRAWYRVTHSPWAGIVSARLVQESRLPYLAALVILSVVFVGTWLRALNGSHDTRRRSGDTPA